jgi:predicted MPP superfamily phosphohydrolase
MKKLSRRQLLGLSAGIGLGGIIGVPTYMRFVEPRWLRSSHWRLALPNMPKLRLLQLSDLHHSKYVPLEFIAKAIDRGLEQQPDLICLTGDFVSREVKEGVAYSKILSRLSDAAPTFAVTGNHDGGSWMATRGGPDSPKDVLEVLGDAGIQALNNRSAAFAIGGKTVQIVGLSDLWSEQLDPKAAFVKFAADQPRIVLSHNPDSKELLLDYEWGLLLCGHTHGGQLRIPLTGGTPFAPVRDRRFVRGLYPWEGRHLHISAGVGNLHGLRFNCRPEISILDIETA